MSEYAQLIERDPIQIVKTFTAVEIASESENKEMSEADKQWRGVTEST